MSLFFQSEFLEKVFFSFSFFLEVQAEKQIQGFQKLFTGDILLYLLNEYFCNCSPKMRTKHFKN